MVKSNVAIVGPRVRFPAGAETVICTLTIHPTSQQCDTRFFQEPEHIRNAVQVLNRTSALDKQTDFLNHLAPGLVRFPKEVQPFLAGASLIGLTKKDGGISQTNCYWGCVQKTSWKTFTTFFRNAFVHQVVEKLRYMSGDK